MMAAKTAPLGICDHCGGTLVLWYTRRRLPRRYGSRSCRNTANSRAGAPTISRKNLERVAAGTWQNPHHLNPPSPEEQSRRSSLGRRREVEAGTWRNPALSDKAREKLSWPRKHEGALHSAIEKLHRGASTSELTPEQWEAHRAWRRELEAARREADLEKSQGGPVEDQG